jgi:hypothetical protein
VGLVQAVPVPLVEQAPWLSHLVVAVSQVVLLVHDAPPPPTLHWLEESQDKLPPQLVQLVMPQA